MRGVSFEGYSRRIRELRKVFSQAREIKWIIITKENAQETFKKLEEKGVDIVLFGLTDEGYEQLAMTMAELRNYIATQRNIIIKYREYYEPTKTPDSK